MCGSCKTENLGLEKVIANIVANPNIRFALFCGTEVKGHLSGQTFGALHKNGVKDGRVVGAEGAIPFIENLKDEHIKRFQEQVEVVNIMETEDNNAIKAKMNELKARDPGAFAVSPLGAAGLVNTVAVVHVGPFISEMAQYADVVLPASTFLEVWAYEHCPLGSGIAEVGATSMYALFIPASIVGIFVVIWRVVLYYFNIALGVLSSIIIVRREAHSR
jgi:tetrahydromethanopterin S-methyltransferase subunit A